MTLEYASEGTVVATGRLYGKPVHLRGRHADRKITHWRDYLDPLRVLDALAGVAPNPATPV